MNLKNITEYGALQGKYVLVRASFNVPLFEGTPRNSFRLVRALPTLTYLHEAGARTIIISHIGRDPKDSLLPVFEALKDQLPFTWGGGVMESSFAQRRAAMQDGDLLMAENLRQLPGEEDNDEALVAHLASLAEVYVNDAFAEAHREHASTFGVAAHLPAYAGLTLIEEVSELEKAMTPTAPSLFLLGGAKFETKMPLVEKYLAAYDHVFIGGAITHDILKARGYEVGQSLVSDVSLTDAPFLYSEKLLLPIDVIVTGPSGVVTKAVDQVLPDEKIMDAGPETVAFLAPYIKDAKTILWNGPFGNYEAGFVKTTEDIARTMALSDAFTVVGGGDTVAAIEKLGLNDKFGFISIGGGAMLTLLEHGSTPAIDRLRA